MAIQMQLQRRNFGPPVDSAPQYNQIHPNLQPGPQVLSQQRTPTDPCILSSMAEMQSEQMDRFIRLQGERFRILLQQKRNHQIGLLLTQIENRTSVLFREKDEEIARANKRRIELEQFLAGLQMENQERQRVVQENEATVAFLSNALEQIRERQSSCAEDAESSNNNRGGEENGIDHHHREKRFVCRICKSRSSCVLLLPCRHLCSCKPCENGLDYCPVCNATKTASIEAVIF